MTTQRTIEELADLLAVRLAQTDAMLRRHTGEFYEGSLTRTLNTQVLAEHRQRKAKEQK